MSQDIFNDYDEAGFRRNIMGCVSSRREDTAIRDNLRLKFGEALESYSDQRLLNAYDEFCFTDTFMFDGDLNFIAWMEENDK